MKAVRGASCAKCFVRPNALYAYINLSTLTVASRTTVAPRPLVYRHRARAGAAIRQCLAAAFARARTCKPRHTHALTLTVLVVKNLCVGKSPKSLEGKAWGVKGGEGRRGVRVGSCTLLCLVPRVTYPNLDWRRMLGWRCGHAHLDTMMLRK